MTACPVVMSRELIVTFALLCSTRSIPFRTIVNSSNSGVWPGSSHPWGLRMWATLAAEVFVLTRPTYSSMSLGLLPADWILVGCGIRVGIGLASGFQLPISRVQQKLYRKGREEKPRSA